MDCVITNNSAVQGGGVYAQSVTIDGCHFEGNLVGSADDDRRGGNILVDANAKVMNSKFTGTCSAKRGACLGFMGTGAVVSNCVFSGLAPSGSYGVMQFTYTAAQSTFADCVFTNMAFNSALFFPQNSSVSILIRQCLFGENSGTAAIISDRGGKLRFENCTIAASKFDSKDSDSGQNVLVNCIAPYADITSSGAFVNIVTNSLVKSVSGGTQDSRVMTDPRFLNKSALTEKKLNGIRKLNDLAQQRGQTLAQMSLAWLLQYPVVCSVLAGASRPEQLLDNIRAAENTAFTAEENELINRITEEML